MTCHGDDVTVLEELALVALPNVHLSLPLPAQLQHAPEPVPLPRPPISLALRVEEGLALVGPGDGAGAEEVARPHVAAPGGVVDELLRRGPVHVLVVGLGDDAGGAHALALDAHIQLHRDREGGRSLEVGQRRRVLTMWSGVGKAGQRTGATWGGLGMKKGRRASVVTTQGEMLVPKFFPLKGPSGWYSHFWMSRAAIPHASHHALSQSKAAAHPTSRS